ncbi:FABP family protein [Glutamicibacter sp. MNS18]|uniref:FABP family protein n=1 Tax=Glutamicibacter sp. MNS18 TaxID=2989817 RepID=UPI0022365792|nr:FABP family protein [Glutamicibacter sp. MNS18]MCW4464272.1 FABP family protein [Glutamicibacter sp. MNS18]
MTPHPGLAAVAGLIGTWRGEGVGQYPTIDSFSYTEEVTFTDAGKPFLHYLQRTWSPAGAPMHTETGYLRVVEGTRVEFVLAQPTGQTELAEGSLVSSADGFTCLLASRIVNSASAKQVDATRRRLELAGDILTTHFAMAAVGVPLTHHLASVMHRD